MKYIALAIGMCFAQANIHALVMSASDFNAAAKPVILTETTTIELDDNIIFSTDGLYAPIQASGSFTADDKLIFTSTSNNAVAINSDTIWHYDFNMEFQGNAQLIMSPGSGLYALGFSITIGPNAEFITSN